MGEIRNIWPLLALLWASACSGEEALVADGPLNAGVTDGAVDAARDAAVDAARDASVDAAPDGNTMAVCPDGTPQALAECVSGLFWADCGGLGPTKLACREDSCSWFTTSCLPAGYEASDCAANDICCHEGFNMPIGCFTSGTLTLPKIPGSAAELSTMPYRLDVTRGAFRLQAAF